MRNSLFSSVSVLFLSAVLFGFFTAPACTPGPVKEKPTGKDGGSTTKDGGSATEKKTPVAGLAADGYTSYSDVTTHNKVPQDIGDIKELLKAGSVDWTKVQELYEKGKHSVKSDGSVRTLNGFASKPDNFIKYSPDAVAYFKDKGICQLAPVTGFKCTEGKYVDELVESYAIKGTGPFEKASDAVRGAVVKSGLLALMSYWVRLEFGKAIAKVKAGNADLEKGGPHNWDEAFAFYWGPEGKHSLYTLAADLSSKYKLATSINADFFKALIDGQKKMKDEQAAPEEATKAGNKQLIRLFVLAAIDAAKELDAAGDDAAKDVARWKGFGYWTAMGHAVAKADASAGEAFMNVFFKKTVTKDHAKAIQDAVKKALSGLGLTEADFGDALK